MLYVLEIFGLTETAYSSSMARPKGSLTAQQARKLASLRKTFDAGQSRDAQRRLVYGVWHVVFDRARVPEPNQRCGLCPRPLLVYCRQYGHDRLGRLVP